MEELFLRTCMFLFSLLCLNEYTIIEELDDDSSMCMQQRKHLLQEEARLELQVPPVAIELPHSDQEVLQSHCRLTKEESDVQQILPNDKVEMTQEHQMLPVEDQDILYQKLLTKNKLDKSHTDKTVPLSDDKALKQAPNVNHMAYSIDHNHSSMQVAAPETPRAGQDDTMSIQSMDGEKVGPKKEATVDKGFPHIAEDMDTSNKKQIKEGQAILPLSNTTHNDQNDFNLGQVGTTVKQNPSEEVKTILHKEHKSFFQNIYEFLYQWPQTSQKMHQSQHDESLTESKQSQMQLNERTDMIQEQALRNQKKCRADQQEPQDSHTSQEQTKPIPHSGLENSCTWYLWKVFSLISLIRLLSKFFGRGLKTSGNICPTMEIKKFSGSAWSLPDHNILSCFYDQCVQNPPNICERVCEFAEGFVDELLEVVRRNGDKETHMQVEDFVGVGSFYELWATDKRMVCDLYVSFTAPKSHTFDFEFFRETNCASLAVGCGKIKMMKTENISNTCSCNSENLDDDTLCLLHPHIEMKCIRMDATNGPLCKEKTPYLSKAQVVRWFRAAVSKAWGEISHKYEFELRFRNQVAPGALKVRFRSGQVILFNITPVVQVKGSKVHLVSYLSSNQSSISDTNWPISMAGYENALLQHFNRTLPYNSCHIKCLQILSFLHKQQISLTGKCGLTSYHLKTTLLHLLLVKKPTVWKYEQLAKRLIDMMSFLEQRLQARELHHALLGNPLIPTDIGLPKELQAAKPTNLLVSLASNSDLYAKTVQHLQELKRNAPVLIQEYASIKGSTGKTKAKDSV